MGKFGRALKMGLKGMASAFQPGQFVVESKRVECPHCGNDQFAAGSAQLNTASMSFFGLDWTDKSAHTLMCTECGRIEWFGQAPERE